MIVPKFCNKLFFLTASVVICLTFFVVSRNTFSNSQVFIFTNPQVEEDSNDFDCVILFWTKFMGREPNYIYGNDRLITDHPNCYDRCRIVTNREFLNSSDAVIFHSRDLKKNDFPAHRPASQIWIYLQHESPQFFKENLKPYGNLFNWTMTYRRDSEIYHPYYKIIPVANATNLSNQFDGPPPPIDEEFFKKKTKSVAWIVSHCKTTSKREAVVNELKKYIDVDVYGKCGNLTCPPGVQEMCIYDIGKKYKFYLSFENSLCADYITEKFFRALQSYIVPIVYGGGDYSSIAPNQTYINLYDFKSVKALADYVKYLETNPDKYLEYFWWVDKYKVSYGDGYCSLCQKVKAWKSKVAQPDFNLNFVSRVYEDLSGWWNHYGSSLSDNLTAACHKPKAEYLSSV